MTEAGLTQPVQGDVALSSGPDMSSADDRGKPYPASAFSGRSLRNLARVASGRLPRFDAPPGVKTQR